MAQLQQKQRPMNEWTLSRQPAIKNARPGQLPYNLINILKNVDIEPPLNLSSTEKLLNQLYQQGVFLDSKSLKYWVNRSGNSNGFVIYATALSIEWVDNPNHWKWIQVKEQPNDTLVHAAELVNIRKLEATARFSVSNLTPGKAYHTAFVVKLQDEAEGWDSPVTFKLVLPDGSEKKQEVNLETKERNKWVEIRAGDFVAPQNNAGEIVVTLDETDGDEKTGLTIKGVVIRPKN